MVLQAVSFVLLVVGEALSIYAEMRAAHDHATVAPLKNYLATFPLIALAGGMLLAGYILGYVAFKNIWVVTAVSITSILLVEPAMAYGFFRELPTRGATVGLICGGLGLLATMTLK